jgi:superfamily I DNA and/or RNA helicase
MVLNQKLEEFKKKFYQFSIDDYLVNFKATKAIQAEQTLIFKKQEVKSILKEAIFFEKESGLNSLCLIQGIVKLNYCYKIINTPVFIKSCHFYEEKTNEIVRFEPEDEAFEMNPFLLFYLKEYFGKELSSVEDCLFFLKNNLKDSFLENETHIGNFHPYRHRFLYELNNILTSDRFSNPLKHLFGELTSNYQSDNLSQNTLFDSDEDQEKVTELIKSESLIIQGPPGTGKSQTISNTLFKFLELDKSILVVSEKKAALEVVLTKLKEKNLDLISIFTTSSNNNQEIYSNLKETWIQFENYPFEKQKNIIEDPKHKFKINEIISGFQKTDAIGGISLASFFKSFPKFTMDLKRNFIQNIPTLYEFNSFESSLQQLSESDFSLLKNLSYSVFNLTNDEIIEGIKSSFETIQKLKKTFLITQISDLELLIKRAITFQNLNSTVYKKYSSILSKNTKKFLSLRKKWNSLNNKLLSLKIHENHWKITPSFDEIDLLRNQANSKKIFDKILWKSRWKKWTRSPNLNAIDQLNFYQKSLELNLEIGKLKQQFLELEIANTDEIETIYSLIKTTNLDDWNDFVTIDKTQLQEILNSHSTLKNLQQQFLTFLDSNSTNSIEGTIEKLNSNLDEIITLKTHLEGISKDVIESLKFANNFEEYKQIVYSNTWRNFVLENPVFRNFEFSEFYNQCKAIISKEKENATIHSHLIIKKQIQKFRTFHELINTPNSKLKEEQKELKSKLKIGKSILVKEFSKQRNHLTLRQLIESEANLWISVLKPIWLTNPAKLALSFPMKTELFDLVIFDEAGRIPITHAIGAMQRAKKAIVAGDPQQMGPSSYFGENSIDETDLLHQATYYFKNVFLSNHYRSKNKNLIEFSNAYFYDNKLNVYPKFNLLNEQPIQLNYVKNAIYKEGQNEIEALQVAIEIEKRMLSTDTIGIVAFSESQLNLIFSKLNSKNQELLLERIKNDTAFFKTLEQVQGDECDLLLISFGYGKNEDGKFEMRFGPLNQQNGKKRLNVLFTRARNKIIFYASVKSDDFPISENESIRLLWLWFCFIEKIKDKSSKNNLPISNEIQFKELVYSSTNRIELLNKISVWEERGWKFIF